MSVAVRTREPCAVVRAYPMCRCDRTGGHLRWAGSETQMCAHSPQCPAADSAARTLAVVIADHHEQGWTLLCNGVVHFDDGVDLLPGGAIAENGVISGDAAFGNCCSSSGAVRARVAFSSVTTLRRSSGYANGSRSTSSRIQSQNRASERLIG